MTEYSRWTVWLGGEKQGERETLQTAIELAGDVAALHSRSAWLLDETGYPLKPRCAGTRFARRGRHKTRFIWLKNPWNLTEAQHRRLGELERLNLKINRAYLLKETFAHFWSYHHAAWARRYLKRWFWWATHARLPPLRWRLSCVSVACQT